jgi:hypothetical protein
MWFYALQKRLSWSHAIRRCYPSSAGMGVSDKPLARHAKTFYNWPKMFLIGSSKRCRFGTRNNFLIPFLYNLSYFYFFFSFSLTCLLQPQFFVPRGRTVHPCWFAMVPCLAVRFHGLEWPMCHSIVPFITSNNASKLQFTTASLGNIIVLAAALSRIAFDLAMSVL